MPTKIAENKSSLFAKFEKKFKLYEDGINFWIVCGRIFEKILFVYKEYYNVLKGDRWMASQVGFGGFSKSAIKYFITITC